MARAALFDVDGTLVDTNHLHTVTWWEAFRQGGHRVTMHAVHRAVGLGSTDLIAHLLGEGRDRDEDDALSDAHRTLYGTYFERLAAFESAGDLLRTLARRDWRIVLVTSASGAELGALRRAVDADEAVLTTTSADDVSSGKPAPEPVLQALELAEARAEDSVFVGDTVWDMAAGTRAGVTCVGLLSGGIPRAALEAAGATALYRDPAELLGSLDDSPLG
ncbi:HAD family hydrolase [Streptomyces wuyuanensis]|uniref:Haloacid dehalogenase superfamily, subfamily IA, variant 3 with third motif having DD or ED n=1 Tax=Streptomyces wuyuanensis TaxID=1196353 RepID=A0A1G9TVM7_9ACTN|nr:HAD family hydrolase [Streptomyces wuyuanensis]SDM51305.1 haloacid dehalogenase superfamily, subfamily IA, variant 3 with third motif having DD or ED [Streptomyces wuyuanensis]